MMRKAIMVLFSMTSLACGSNEAGDACEFPETGTAGSCQCADGYTRIDAKCVETGHISCCECLGDKLRYDNGQACLANGVSGCVDDPAAPTQCYCWNQCATVCQENLRPSVCEECGSGRYFDEAAQQCADIPVCPANSSAVGPGCVCDEGYSPAGEYCVMLKWHCGDGVCFDPCEPGKTGACSGTQAVCCDASRPYACEADTLCHANIEDCSDVVPGQPIPCP